MRPPAQQDRGDHGPNSPPDPSRFFTVSNLLSIGRGLLAIPFALVLSSGGEESRIWGAVIMAAAALTDKFDGVIARRYGQATEWGRILDPLADKIAVAAGGIVMLALSIVPLWFVLVVVCRDLLIFAGGVYLKAIHGTVLPSNRTGKWAVGIVSLTLFCYLLNLPGTVTAALALASVILLLASLALYLARFVSLVRARAGVAETRRTVA